jgi:hypothetical protein
MAETEVIVGAPREKKKKERPTEKQLPSMAKLPSNV